MLSALFRDCGSCLFRLVLTVLLISCVLVIASCSQENDPASSTSSTTEPRKQASSSVSELSAVKAEIKCETVDYHKMGVTLHVTGQIQPEVGKEVDVNTRFSGRVTSVLVTPGQLVKPGDILSTVDSQEISNLQAELIEDKSKLFIAEAHEERERQIYEELLMRPKSLIQARTHHDETKVQLELADSEFQRQEGLYKEKISSAKDYFSAKASLAKARAAFAQAVVDLQREERLYKNKALMKRDYQLAQAETARARQHLNTLEQRLIFLGMAPQMVQAIKNTGKIVGEIPIVCPAAGVVSHQGVAVGEMVDRNTSAFRVTDLTSVAVKADIPEADVSRVKLGSAVKVRVAGYPNEQFVGSISYISEYVNPETRTVAIRAKLVNPDKRLKSNMFADIDLEEQPTLLLACPKSAVQERDGRKVVYVLSKGTYQERAIETGRETDEYYEVLSGLAVGERVATQGSLMLKTELTYQR